MKIAFLDNTSMCYGTLNYFLEQIMHTCENAGIETVRITSLTTDFFKEKWDAVLGINQNTFSAKLEDGSFLMDLCNCPLISLIVDAPYYHDLQLREHPKNMHLICLDEDHVNYANAHYGQFQSVRMAYLAGPVAKHPMPYKERPISLLFTGTNHDCRQYREQLRHATHPIIMPLFDFIIENNISNPDVTTEESVIEFCRVHQVHYDEKTFHTFMTNVGITAELYLRSYYREKIIRILVNGGIDVTIAGDGWEEVFPEKPDNLHLLGSLDFEAATELSGQAKICLNVMPLFKAGLHDRILTGIQNGGLVLTDSSSYIDSHFTDGENIVLYDLHQLELLPELVNNILADDETAEEIIANGQNFIRSRYCWERFVLDYILPCLS
ncbi:MAG: glycosyltransferase [Lachnospiraceae bacterium]